ncbi:inner centromere protein, ARK-binding region protein [Thalictrum thalictroides]|uniref:Inner centromere protein, ARK-binding region protein n=1 Tax=Thalictrum thalictroides TaxID=46969 RepID=A0A7J6X8J5_THATH|nr:inner centromere protein, ARK-binding region protein [Thalictrum thalictroides]
MSTLEKLFVQIFDRRRWIVDQVKQQSDLFDQYLASHCLINGIRPPSWLLSSGFDGGSADFKELKKEDLISGLLFPPPRPNHPSTSSHNTFYHRPSVTGKKVRSSDVLFAGTCDYDKFSDVGDRMLLVPEFHFNDRNPEARSSPKVVPEQNPAFTSPLVQEVSRMPDSNFDLDLSLAGLKRSRSRQKALELRSSAKSETEKDLKEGQCKSVFSGKITKSGTCSEQFTEARELLEQQSCSNTTSEGSFRVTRSWSGTHQIHSVEKPFQLSKSTNGGDNLHNALDSAKSEIEKHSIAGKCPRDLPGRNTRSRSCSEHSSQVRESLEQQQCSNITNGVSVRVTRSRSGTHQLRSVENPCQFSNTVNGRDGLYSAVDRRVSFSSISVQKDNFMGPNTEEYPSEGELVNDCSGRDKVSQIDERLMNPDTSQNVPSGRVAFSRSTSEKVTSGRVSPSRSSPSNEHSQSHLQSDMVEGHEVRKAIDIPLIPVLGNDLNGILDPENFNDVVPDTEFVSSLPAEASSNCLGSDMGNNCRVEEFSVSSPPSGDDIFVEPKQLFFDEIEDCSSNGRLTLHSDKEKENGSKGKDGSVGPTASLRKVIVSNEVPEKYDAEIMERDKSLEVMNNEKKLRASSDGQDAHACSKKPSNIFVTSPTKGSPENSRHILIDTSPGSCENLKQGNASSNYIIALEVCREGSLQGDVDRDLLDLHIEPAKVGTVEISTHQLDVVSSQVLTEGCKLVSVPNGREKLLSHGINGDTLFSQHRECEFSLKYQEIKYDGALDADGRSVLMQEITTNPAEMSSRQKVPYMLRSHIKHGKNDVFSVSDESSFQRRSIKSKPHTGEPSENSWPLFKRRKIESRSSKVHTASPRLVRVEPLQRIDGNNISHFHGNTEDGLITDPVFENATSSSDVKATRLNVIETPGRSAKRRKTESYEASRKPETKEVNGDMNGGETDTDVSLGLNQTCTKASIDSILNGGESENAHDGLLGSKEIDATQLASDHDQTMLFPGFQKIEELGPIEGALQDTKSVTGEQLFSHCSAFQDSDLIAANQYIPEFEGFSIGLPSEQIFSLSGDKISVENIDLPTSTTERISFLERLCRSTSTLTPLPQSSKYKIHRTPDVYQSLPNGLLERIDLRNTLPFSDEDLKQLKASYTLTGEESDLASYSGCMPSSSVQLDLGVGHPPCTPPVRRLGQRTAPGHTRYSLEKQHSVNPELTCFRIDEDTSTSEDDMNIEVVDVSHDGISPRSISLSHRRPLVDLSNSKVLPLISVAKNVHERGSLDTLNTDQNMSCTQNNAKQKLRSAYRKDKTKKNTENQSSSLRGNGVGKVSESFHNTTRKLSRKASEERKPQSLLDKGCKRANIVSNVSSFIPLVQQKQQPSALITGKRDVKVKALETAEAAKRLEEKRENERKMKKEAAKLERARLEEERNKQVEIKEKKKEEERKKKEADVAAKLERARLEEERIKQFEMKQKKNEEERKKKGADVAARKRHREEEDRKEKERKRRCNEEARRQQKEQDKLRAEKEEKEQRCRHADEREGKKKYLLNEEQKCQKPVKGSEIDECTKEMETGSRVVNLAVENANKASDICDNSEVLEGYHDEVVRNSSGSSNCGFSFTEVCGEQSYEISPYQVSDDEEEEEDVIPNKKFIPSWAREKQLALVLPSLKEINPFEIFLPTKCCSISEGAIGWNCRIVVCKEESCSWHSDSCILYEREAWSDLGRLT